MIYEVAQKDKRRLKVMISQPMAGKSEEEIKEIRTDAIKYLEEQGYEVIDSVITDESFTDKKMKERGIVQIPVAYLAKSLEYMSLCHAVYFLKGWEDARGCRIEHDIASAYGLKVVHEE